MNSTKRLIFIAATILLVLLCSAVVIYCTEKRDYEIWGRKGKETIIQPHIAPLIGVQQVSGPPIPEHGSLACEFKQDSMLTPKGDKIKILHGYCENGIVVTITGIDLNH